MGAPAEPPLTSQAPLSVRTIRPAETGTKALMVFKVVLVRVSCIASSAWSGKEVSKSNNAPGWEKFISPGDRTNPDKLSRCWNKPGTVGLPAEAAPRVVVAAAPPTPEKVTLGATK